MVVRFRNDSFLENDKFKSKLWKLDTWLSVTAYVDDILGTGGKEKPIGNI